MTTAAFEVQVNIYWSHFPAYGDFAVMRTAGKNELQSVQLLATAAPFDIRKTRVETEEVAGAQFDENGRPMPSDLVQHHMHDGIQSYWAVHAPNQQTTDEMPICHPVDPQAAQDALDGSLL